MFVSIFSNDTSGIVLVACKIFPSLSQDQKLFHCINVGVYFCDEELVVAHRDSPWLHIAVGLALSWPLNYIQILHAGDPVNTKSENMRNTCFAQASCDRRCSGCFKKAVPRVLKNF